MSEPDANTMAMVDVLGDPRCGVHFDEESYRWVFVAPSITHPGRYRVVASMAGDLFAQDKRQMAKLIEVAMGILMAKIPLKGGEQ